jgi:hypothetical protein
MWNGCFSGPTENFGNEHQNKARYMNSTSATHFMKLRLRCLDEMRRVYFTCVSAQLVFVTGIKQQPLPQLATGHVKMTVSLGPQGTLVTGTKTRLVTVKSISETRVVNLRLRSLNERATLSGPPVSIGNGLLRCPLLCWHICNWRSNWSLLLSGQCL